MPTNAYQRTAIAAAIAACYPGVVWGAGVARVDFATGNVSATAADGRSRALSKGAEIQVGETVSTQQGRAQLRFADGAYMSLQPQTEFKVEQFSYSGKPDGNENIVMNLIKGGMRTITGLIGRTNRNAYRLKTDVATIGIRGTEYSVRYTNSIELFCADGAVSVENQSGTFVVPGGNGVMVSNQQTAPQQTDQKPVLPPESPAQEEQQKVTEKPSDPVNPIQQSEEATLPPSGANPITGTLAANYAVIHPSYSQSVAGGTVTFDGTGNLTAFDGFEGPMNLGSSIAVSSGNDGVIAWGRWTSGTTSGVPSLNTSAPSELHYVVGLPPTAMPTSGEATYSMIGATPPSSSESVTLNSSMLKVNFGTFSGTFHANFTVNGSTVATPGGGVGFGVCSPGLLSGGGCMTGPFCFQSISLQGILSGAGASRAGMVYTLNTAVGGAHGAIAYQQSSLVPSLPVQ